MRSEEFRNATHIANSADLSRTVCGKRVGLVTVTTYKAATCGDCRKAFGPLPPEYRSTRTHTRNDF